MQAHTALTKYWLITNGICFQILWWAVVYGAAQQHYYWGLWVIAIWLPVHLYKSAVARVDLLLVASFIAVGLLVENAAVYAGLYDFKQAAAWLLAPEWMLLLWMGLALTIQHSLAFLQKNAWLPIVLGAVSGPLSYLAGERFGVINIPNITTTIICLAILWASVMWLTVRLVKRL